MACEMCGSQNQEYRCEVEGVIMNLCEACSKFGKRLKRLEPEHKAEKKKALTKPAVPAKKEIIQIIVPDYPTRIKNAREKTGMTQEEFAKKLSERESVIHHLESGKMRPSIDLARKFEKALRIKLVEQIEESGDKRFAAAKGQLTIGDVLVTRNRK